MALSISPVPSANLIIPKIPKTSRFFNSHHPHLISIRPRSSTSMANPTTRSSFDLSSYWASIISIIDSELSSVLTMREPKKMYEAMCYSVLCGGTKRAPPILCIASCELFGTPRSAALPTAAALEMVHAASLVHDDLPCMDGAPLCRGRPSTHAKYGTGVAVPVGDALFPLAFEHVVTKTPPDLIPREVLLSVLKEIARTVGSTGMAAGQYLDLTGADVSGEADVLLCLEKKFGELAKCSAVCGAMLGGAKGDDQLALRRYGRAVGVLYELVNDLLMESNGQAGKMRSNASVVRTLGTYRTLELVEQLRDKAKEELLRFGDRYGDRVLPLYSLLIMLLREALWCKDGLRRKQLFIKEQIVF